MRRFLAILLVLTITLSLAAAEGKAYDYAYQKAAAEYEPPVAPRGEVNAYGWLVPMETLKFNVYTCGTDTTQDDWVKSKAEDSFNIMDKFLLNQFNVEIDYQHSVQDASEAIGLQITEDKYYDLYTWANNAHANLLRDAGVAVELTGLLEQYGQTILAEVGSYIELLKEPDGSIYKMPVYYGPKIDQVGNAFSIRYDWWLELKNAGLVSGYPRTVSEWYDQMKLILANHPTNAAGNNVYAVGSMYQGITSFLATLQGAWGYYSGFDVGSDNTLTYWLNTERAAEMVTFANRLWREGMIDPDILSMGWDTSIAKYAEEERLAGNISVWWWMFVLGHEYWQERDAASPLEKRFVNLAVRADSVEHQTLASLTFLSGNYWVLTDAADNPEQIISWLNWESTPYGIVITNWGVPSSENIYDFVDGKVVFREDSLDPAKKNIEYHKRAQSWGEKTYSLCERRSAVQDGVTELPFSIDPRVADTFSSQDMYVLNNTLDGYADVGWGICWGDYDLEWVWEATALNTFTLTSDDELYDTNSYITSNAEPWFVKMMTAESEEQCLKFLADARADFAAQGLKELEQFRTEAFKANLATLDQPGIVFVNK